MAVAGTTSPAIAGDEASTGPLALTWDAPPGCPSRTEVVAEVARLFGGTIPLARTGAVEANASVVHGQPWLVSITTRNAGAVGRRSLEAASCQDLADATAMILALMIDPEAVAAHAREPKAEPPAAPPASVEATVAPPPVHPMAVLAAVHGQTSLGVLPGLDAGVGVGLGLSGRRWRVELRGTYGLRRDQVAHAPADSEGYGRFNFLGGTLAACLNLGEDAVGFGPCADAELGTMSARGYGVSTGFPARSTWFAAGAGGYVAIALGRRFAIPVRVEVMAPLLRPRYVIKEVEGTVYQAPAVGLRLAAGLEWRF